MPELADYKLYDWEVHYTGGVLTRAEFYPDLDDPETTRRDLDPEKVHPHPFGMPERIVMIPQRAGFSQLSCEIPPGAFPVLCIFEHEKLAGAQSTTRRWHRIGWNKPGVSDGCVVWIRVFSLINVETGEVLLIGVDNEGHRIRAQIPGSEVRE